MGLKSNMLSRKLRNMKERPILFSAEMVNAIMSGRKTQTRRIVKPEPDSILNGEPYWNIGGLRLRETANNPLHCKYGSIGDRLWVRETFWHNDEIPGIDGCCYRADGEMPNHMIDGGTKWKPSIFMPRWASRILLEITDIRVERLQDISESDAKAEGCRCNKDTCAETGYGNYRDSYRALWESINGKGSWDTNPFVFAISFKRITQ